jgi:hypothetical protein
MRQKPVTPDTEPTQTIEELEMEIFILEAKEAIQRAYEQGVEDGKKRFSLPIYLTRAQLKELLHIGETKATELMRQPGFPVSRKAGVLIRSEHLLQWMDNHAQWVKENTGYFDNAM